MSSFRPKFDPVVIPEPRLLVPRGAKLECGCEGPTQLRAHPSGHPNFQWICPSGHKLKSEFGIRPDVPSPLPDWCISS